MTRLTALRTVCALELYFEGYATCDIAQFLDVSCGSVESMVRRYDWDACSDASEAFSELPDDVHAWYVRDLREEQERQECLARCDALMAQIEADLDECDAIAADLDTDVPPTPSDFPCRSLEEIDLDVERLTKSVGKIEAEIQSANREAQTMLDLLKHPAERMVEATKRQPVAQAPSDFRTLEQIAADVDALIKSVDNIGAETAEVNAELEELFDAAEQTLPRYEKQEDFPEPADVVEEMVQVEDAHVESVMPSTPPIAEQLTSIIREALAQGLDVEAIVGDILDQHEQSKLAQQSEWADAAARSIAPDPKNRKCMHCSKPSGQYQLCDDCDAKTPITIPDAPTPEPKAIPMGSAAQRTEKPKGGTKQQELPFRQDS